MVESDLRLGGGRPGQAEGGLGFLRRLGDEEVAVQAITVRVPAQLGTAVRPMQETARQFGALLRVVGSPEPTGGWRAAWGAAHAGRR